MNCLATIVVPTHDHGGTIRHALASALRQTVQQIEVIIIGDGVAEVDKPLLLELASSDSRVRFIDHPKHESRGEPYRHAALQEAMGQIVCYLCDRDLWLPCHVEHMLKQLEHADFTHSLSMHVLPDGIYRFYPTDLALPGPRRRMRDVENRVALSCAAHTMEAYRRLPFGWRTTPKGIPTDWHMFRQFLQMDDCRASSGTFPSAITFPSPPRYGWPRERRIFELDSWAEKLAHEAKRDETVLEILQNAVRARDACLDQTMREAAELSNTVSAIYASRLWRCRETLLRIPGFRSFAEGTEKVFQNLLVR